VGTPLNWVIFNLFILVAIALDLRVFHRHPHKVGLREATIASYCWIAISGLFGLGVLHFRGTQPALEFFTGYLIEKALSVDNLFLFLVIFRAFAVEERLQHRLLEWGVIGALIMRGAMIGVGAELIEHFSWVLYVLGALLVYAGVRLFFKKEDVHPEKSRVVSFASRHMRVMREYQGENFFVRDAGKLFVTPLFVVLLVVEITDVTLAIDSIPAVFGITRDPFIVYTSNVLAILGLRALFFMLADAVDKFYLLKYGLGVVLVFVGLKMVWLNRLFDGHFPIWISLGIICGVRALSILLSFKFPRAETNNR